ncbi:hypothetical protein X945_6068 [Burkholderia pseudomallei ABCPW 107]|nr:hypothetical protein X945_6068 [Burkholderia pseudomallei ABCPW 107]
MHSESSFVPPLITALRRHPLRSGGAHACAFQRHGFSLFLLNDYYKEIATKKR